MDGVRGEPRDGRRLPEWVLNSDERIFRRQLGEQSEIPIAGDQLLDTMGQANGSHSRIVNDRPANTRPLSESRKNGGEGVGLRQESDGRRLHPCSQLRPSLVRTTRGCFPDLRVRHDTEELINARPRNRPRIAPLGEGLHELIRYGMLGRFAAMRIHKNVRVHRDQASPPAVDLVTHILPRHRSERVGRSRFPHASVRQRISHALFFQHCPETFFNDRPQWSPGSSGVPLGSIQQCIADFDRRLHTPILPILECTGKPYQNQASLEPEPVTIRINMNPPTVRHPP